MKTWMQTYYEVNDEKITGRSLEIKNDNILKMVKQAKLVCELLKADYYQIHISESRFVERPITPVLKIFK